MKLSAHLIISGKSYAIITTQPGPQSDITVTLDRAPEIESKSRESVMIYNQGFSREPMRMVGLPVGPIVRLRMIYS